MVLRLKKAAVIYSKILFFSSVFFMIYINFNVLMKQKQNRNTQNDIILSDFSPINRLNYPFVLNFDKIDWLDNEFVEYEANRTGLGEQGKPVVLTDPEEIKQNEELTKVEGLSALISDKISVNRSVTDTRPKKYVEMLIGFSSICLKFDVLDAREKRI